MLPVSLMACKLMLVLLGQTYRIACGAFGSSSRFLLFSRLEQALSRSGLGPGLVLDAPFSQVMDKCLGNPWVEMQMFEPRRRI